MNEKTRAFKILLVEDNPGDVRLIIEAFKVSKILVDLDVVRDGVEALKYLQKQGKYKDVLEPDLIFLDLNLPRMDGHETLEQIKSDKNFMDIPVVILTTSDTEEDITRAYASHANAYVTKPVDLYQFNKIVQELEAFWFTIVSLPIHES